MIFDKKKPLYAAYRGALGSMYLSLSPKHKKIIRIIVAVVVAVLMFFGAERAGAAGTIYVPGDYSTIQTAEEAANNGDTIIVGDGCYAENVLVNKSDLTIKSQNARGAIVTAADPNKSVFELNRNRTTISGFTIEGATNAAGIAVKYFSTENKISNNEFAGNKYGIHISLYSYLNEMTGNIFKETNDYGLYLQEAFDSGSGATRKSSANNIYLNDFYSKIFAGSGWPYYNFWKTGEEINYQYAGGYHKNRLGNYYLYYDGTDDNSDGIGEKAQVLNGETDNYPLIKPLSNYEILTEEPDWTFAVLTDLHIGWGIPDYGKPGYEESDNEPGQDYYLTDRLNAAVEWINQHHNDVDRNIKFVAILGDITDTAEYSEFLKAREILNKLEIPYIPLIGNHDIVPYVSKANYDPDDRAWGPITRGIGETRKDGEPMGDVLFEKVFWTENQKNTDKINALFGSNNFKKQPTGTDKYQNYEFDYNGIKFLGLDFASRNETEELMSPFNAELNNGSEEWLNETIDNNQEKTIVFTHYPLSENAGGFYPGGDSKKIRDSFGVLNVLNLAGHTHMNYEKKESINFDVRETEALSQVPFLDYKNSGEFIRLVKIKKTDGNTQIEPNIFIKEFPSAINPYIMMFPGIVSTAQPTTFMAGYKNRTKDEITGFTWQFDDGEEYATENNFYVKPLNIVGTRKVKLTVRDIYGNSESVNWNFEVGEKANTPRKMIMVNGMLIPMMNTGIDLRDPKNGQNTTEWVAISKNDYKLIGGLNTHFEAAEADIDISDFVGDTDTEENKSFMHMDNWPAVIENNKILYIPSTGKGQVYICPQADSLAKVQPNCQDATILTVGETKNGMTVSQIDYLGQPYYQVYGITGTGGGELNSTTNKNLEEQIEVTKLEYDGENILAKIAADIGDKNPPLLLSELKQDKINLTKYLSEIKRLLWPWQTKKLVYKLKFLESIGNEWQGKKIKVWFNFEAAQEK
ncbi:MAG: metallophosphoesterase [Candidatus Nealsonbacteria bacterium]|nr:metallophosphoesterase [Candidatus Nealsonbacteria bacterium]